jgi:putative salt-induced outer membrane protein
MQSKKLTIAVLAFIPTCALAEEDGWKGTGEFGLAISKGNTETQSVTGNLKLGYVRDPWSQDFNAKILQAEDETDETANRYTLSAKTKYGFTDISYSFLKLRYEEDKFSGYEHQSSVGIGYGHKVLDTDIHKLNLELGAGVSSFTEDTPEGKKETYPIVQGNVEYSWQLTDSTALTDTLSVESGSENTLVENALGLAVSISKKLALKLSYDIKHNTEVPEDTDSTDTVLTTNLVYNWTK